MARPVLPLVAEHKVPAFVRPPKGSAVLEASGVVQKDGDDYVVFDNLHTLARIRGGLHYRKGAARLNSSSSPCSCGLRGRPG